MEPSISSSLLLPLAIVTAFLVVAAAASHPDIVRDTCKECSSGDPNVNYTLCIAMFDSVPRSHSASLRGLAAIATRQAAANATHVKSKVRSLMRSHRKNRGGGGGGGGYYASCLDTCLDLYSDAASRLNDSVRAVKAGRYDDANVWISAAVDAPGECEDGFGDEGLESPMTEDNRNFFGLAVIALSIVAMLQGNVH